MTTAAEAIPKKRLHQPLRPLTEDEQELVLRNMGLARGFARRLSWAMANRNIGKRRQSLASQHMDELVGACYYGLCMAAEHYDPSLGPFSSFAYPCIRNCCWRAVADSELKAGTLLERMRILFRNVSTFTDLEMKRWLAGSCSPMQIERSEVAAPAQEEPHDEEHLDYLKWLISGMLSPRYAEVFFLRALDGLNFGQIGAMLGVTRQRAQQIGARALSILRQSGALMKALCEYARNPSEVRRHEAGDVLISTSERR